MNGDWNHSEILPVVRDTIFSLCKGRKNEIISRTQVIETLLKDSIIQKEVDKIKNKKNQQPMKIVGNMVDFLNLWVTRSIENKAPKSWFNFSIDFLNKIERTKPKNTWAYKLRSPDSVNLTNFWIFVGNNQENMTVQEMFERNMRLRYWGFKEGTKKVNDLRIGDKVIFYLSGLKYFKATCTLRSQFLNQNDAKKRGKKFSGVELINIKIWTEPKLTKELVTKLSFIPNPKNWGKEFHKSIIKITSKDFETILGKESDFINEQIELELESTNPNPSRTESPKYTLTKTKIRLGIFRTKVKENYDYACAVCRRSRFDKNDNPEVESSHIYPVENNGSNDPRNGLALCKLHHWAFDKGLFSITDDHFIMVEKRIKKDAFKNQYKEIIKYEGKKLKLPKSKDDWPHKVFLKDHRKKHGFK